MPTESGGNETGDETGGAGGPRTRPVTRRRGRLVTNETAATGGVMHADEDPYTIDVRHLCLASITKFCDDGL